MEFASIRVFVFIHESTNAIGIGIFSQFIYYELVNERIHVNIFFIARLRIFRIESSQSVFKLGDKILNILFLLDYYLVESRVLVLECYDLTTDSSDWRVVRIPTGPTVAIAFIDFN